MTTPPPVHPQGDPRQPYGQPPYGQPPHYGQPQQYYQQPFPPGPPPKKPRNVVGGIALGTAILGFVFGCIPGALIIGWILLPIGFVLGLVGLFMSDRPKGTSIAAVVVSIVGTIVAAVVFLAVVGNAVDSAFGGDSEVSVSDQAAGESTPTQDAPGNQKSDATPGSRNNPATIGATISSGDWEVVVHSFTPNATDQVLAANQFNDAPPPGHQYAVVNMTVTYRGEDSANANDIGISFVTDEGNVFKSYDNPAVSPEPDLDGELYNGAATTGNEVIQIPENASGLLRLRLGMIGDEVFVSTN